MFSALVLKVLCARIKIFLYVLLMELEFSIDPSIEVEKKVKYVFTLPSFAPNPSTDHVTFSVVTRPCVKSEPHMGNQMPLRLRKVPIEADVV